MRGHWRLECPQRPGAGSGNNQETSNYATIAYAQGSNAENEPEIVDRLPWDVIEQSVASSSTQRPAHVSSLISMQHELTMYGQHEYLVDPLCADQPMQPICSFCAKLLKLCQTWTKLRGTETQSEDALVVERAELAILDP